MFLKSIKQINHGATVAIYGAGRLGKRIAEKLKINRPDVTIQCFIDSVNEGKAGYLDVVPVTRYFDAWNQCDMILVASAFWREIVNVLKSYNTHHVAVFHPEYEYRYFSGSDFYIPQETKAYSEIENYFTQAHIHSHQREHNLSQDCIDKAMDFAIDHGQCTLHTVIFLLTSRCNLSCRHCWDRHYTIKSNYESEEMTTSQVLKSLESLYSLAPHAHLFFSGGEVMVREDFMDILDFAALSGWTFTLFSNGTLSDKIKILLENDRILSHLKTLVLSLDGNREVHDHIRGKGTYDRLMLSLEMIDSAGVEVHLNSTVQQSNIKYIENFSHHRNQLSEAFSCITPTHFNVEVRGAGYLSEAEPGALKPYISPDTYRYLSYEDDFTGLGCRAGIRNCTVLPHGDVTACGQVSQIVDGNMFVLGRLPDYDFDFQTLWNNEKAENTRRSIRNCTGCASSCFR